MLNNINLSRVLFLDIETVPETYNYKRLNNNKKKIWEEKYGGEKEYPKSSVLAEFGKIICISVGFFDLKIPKKRSFRIKSFIGEETEILENFKDLCDSHFHSKSSLLCAHNGREFDFPFIARRMIINKIKLPKILDICTGTGCIASTLALEFPDAEVYAIDNSPKAVSYTHLTLPTTPYV